VDFAVTGSALSIKSLHATTPMNQRHNSTLGNVLSVKEICDGKGDVIKQLYMDDSNYVIPKFSWSRTKFNEIREKKLDYITLFPEKLHVDPSKLIKIYAKKKHDTPGPTEYDMTKSWVKKGGQGYDPNNGKHYHDDRITEVAALIKQVKRERLPAPNAYKPKR